MLLRHCRGRENRGFLVWWGACDSTLELHLGTLGTPGVSREVTPPFRIARGSSGFLASRCRGIGPHLVLRPGNSGLLSLPTGISGFLLSCNRGVRPHLVLRQKYAFLSSCRRCVQAPVELRWATGLFLEVAGSLVFLSHCNR